MKMGKFLAELKVRAIEMYEFLEGEEGRARKATQQAMDQASGELPMQDYAPAVDSLGGFEKAEALLCDDMMAMERERLEYIVGKVAREDLQHPGNIVHFEIESLRKGLAEREHLLKLAGYYEGVLQWAEFPVAVWGEKKSRVEIEAQLADIQERIGDPVPIAEDHRSRLRRLYEI